MWQKSMTLCAGIACAAAMTCVAAPADAATAVGQRTLVTEPNDQYATVDSLIRSAQSSVDLTMYELADTTAEQALTDAAARGVRVRVILDANRERSNNQDAYDVLSQGGVSVVWAPARYAATHQKTLTVDGQTSAIMSGNMTSRYYSTSRDFTVVDTDSADVAAIEHVFAADFTGATITPPDGDALVWSPTDSQSKLLALIHSARTSIAVENEEMADPAITDALATAARDGVQVQVTMTDNSDYHDAFDTLVSAGAQVHTYPDDNNSLYIHAKVVDVDAGQADHNAYVGSINFSDYSLNKNRELGTITTDASVDDGLTSTLNSDFADGTDYPSTTGNGR